ncbi:hypothetical protein Trydic_g11249 [Trypoxylus dichotomus]
MAECRDSTINNTNTQKQSIVLGHNDTSEENKTEKVMEPTLIEEMKGERVPRSFEKLRITLVNKGTILERNEYFFLLIHVLMLECGFITLDCRDHYNDQDFGFHFARIVKCVDKLPPNWKRSKTVFSVTYALPPFLQYLCRVTCAECAEDIVVNSSVDGIGGINYSLLVDPSRYIISSASNIVNKFQDIWHLSRIFKATIGSPARNVIMRQNDVPAFCLEDLPIEILWNIMRLFDPKTLAQFERTCRYFRVLSHDASLWKKIPGGKWESFQYYKRNENAKTKFANLLENGSTIDKLTTPEATNLGTTGRIPEHNGCNGDGGTCNNSSQDNDGYSFL